MAVIKKVHLDEFYNLRLTSYDQVSMRVQRKWSPHTLLGGIHGVVIWKIVLQFLKRLNNSNLNSMVLA